MPFERTDEVDRAGQISSVDDDLDLIAVSQFADGAAGERLGRDVADAGSGGDAAEARVGEDGDVFAEGESLEGGGDLVDLLHAGAGGAAAGENHDVVLDDLAGLDGVDGGRFGGEDFGGAEVMVSLVGVNEGRIDGGALDDGAFGSEVADGEADGGGEAAGACAVGGHDDVVGVDAVLVEEIFAQGVAALAVLPPVECGVEGFAGDGFDAGVEESGAAEVEHDLGCSAGEEDLHGGVVSGAVGESVDESRDLAVDAGPVFCCGPVEFRGVGDGGDVEQEIGGAAEGRVDDHRVVDGGVGEDVLSSKVQLLEAQDGAGGAAGGVEPDGLAGGTESGVREGESEGFGDDLRRGGGAEELAASAGSGAGAAANLGGVFERDLMLGEACADGLDLAGVFAVFGQQRDAAGDQNAGQRAGGGQRHHHRGEALVAGGDAEDPGAGGERAHEAAKDDGGVVAVRAASRACRRCPGCGRRRDRCRLRRRGRRAAILSSRAASATRAPTSQ